LLAVVLCVRLKESQFFLAFEKTISSENNQGLDEASGFNSEKYLKQHEKFKQATAPLCFLTVKAILISSSFIESLFRISSKTFYK
jgi:hypothetical protein